MSRQQVSTARRRRRGSAAITLSVALAGLAAIATLLGPPGVNQEVHAEPAFNANWKKGRETGFPVPRYVSLKFGNSRMRVGPSTDYGTRWIYMTQGLPIEITEEYGNWRQVRDYDGISGWMYAPLLSGRRTAVVGPWLKTTIPLHRSASSHSGTLADLEPKVRMAISRCDGKWCHVKLPGHDISGYVEQSSIWGVYPGEKIE